MRRKRALVEKASGFEPGANGRSSVVFDPLDPRSVDRIRAAGTRLIRECLEDPEAAERLRVAEGIYTKTGRLTKAFRP